MVEARYDSNSHFAEYGLRKLQIQPVGAASSRDRTPAGPRTAAMRL